MRGGPHDITGQRFAGLVAVRKCPPVSGKNRGARWVCRCDCGNEKETSYHSLKHGLTTSCGCLRRQRIIAANKARALPNRESPEYYVWQSMRRRCADPKIEFYPNYGGRGIYVCDRWRESFDAFYADMGPRPSPKHSIDRIDNDGPYSPDNCRWATPQEQARNKRRPAPATHCKRGHEYTPENTHIDARGRHCKQCKTAKGQRAAEEGRR